MFKVIHIITDMKIGGAGSWLLNFLGNYDREMLLVKVVIPKGSMLKTEIEKMNIEAIEVQGIADKSLDFASLSALNKLFRSEKPQIVHTHASLSARIAAKLAGIKIIVHTKHCLDSPKSGIKKLVLAGINNQLSTKIIAVSEAVKNNLLEAGAPEEKVQVIYGGVDMLRQLSPEEIASLKGSYGIREADIVFGMAARLAEVKGHKYLIEAAKIVHSTRKDVKIIIAGTGPLEKQLKEMVQQSGLDTAVIFTGFIKDIELIYNVFDVNMITSLSEALCLSLLEGMTLGKPMIGTRVGGVPELVIHKQTGLLVSPRQPEALAEAILELADNSEQRRAMGENARSLVLEKFSASVMAARIQELYKELLSI